VGGRLNGAEIARTGVVSGRTSAAAHAEGDIDYGLAGPRPTYGTIGVKVWLYKGEMAKTKSRRRRSE
jgi:small subunit ribosomal protein S3